MKTGSSSAAELWAWTRPMPNVPQPIGVFRKRCPICRTHIHGEVIQEYWNSDVHDGFGDHWRLFEYKCTNPDCDYKYQERH